MRLIERDRELAQMSALLAECARGGCGAAVISSAIGCGKTEFLAAVKRRAASEGLLVAGAVGSWTERQWDGGVLQQIQRALRLPTSDAYTSDTLHQVCEEMVRISADVPVLVCVDDVQFTDPLSARWLLLLLQRLREARIAVVVTECAASSFGDPQLHAALLRQPTYRRITLRPLSPDGVTALLAEHLPADATGAVGEDCHALSGGNPLLVRALIEDSRDMRDEAGSLELTVAEVYGETVLSCLHGGRSLSLRAAQALAVLDEDRDAGLLPRLLRAEPAAVVRDVRALAAAGLLAGRRLRHPAARRAVLDGLAPASRADLHLRSAVLLYEEGAAATRVARHLLAAASFAAGNVRRPWAVPVLREAGERYLDRSRPAEAHACFEAALRICDDDAGRVGLRVLLASAAWMLNPSISAQHLGELAVALSDGRLPDKHALMLAKYLLWHGRFDEAVDAVDRLCGPGGGSDPDRTAEARATRTLLSATYPGLVPPGRGTGSVVEADARIRGAAALRRVLTEGPGEAVVTDAETAMRAMRLGKNTQEWITCAVAALGFADRLKAASDWCDHWLEESRARHVPLWVAEFASLQASIALRRGEPLAARRMAETALTQVSAESWGVCIGGPLAHLVQAGTDSGDHEAAAEYLDVPVPDGVFASRFGLYYLHARGRHHLATGRPYAALDDFVTCGDLMRRWGFDHPTLVPWRSCAAEAHLALGDEGQARQSAGEELALAGERPSRARAVSLRALAATLPHAERPGLLTEAVGLFRVAGDRLRLAGALADLGGCLTATGRPGRADSVLRTAARLAEEVGAAPLLRSIDARRPAPREAGPVPGDPQRALSLLSDAERRVTELAAHGHTNKEISQKLTVTVSTVEQHLTRAFRKLGVRTRKELPVGEIVGASVR